MVEIQIKKAKNLFEKVKGLIGKKEPMAFYLKTRFGIHTFGLRFPIDVVILDSRHKIVHLKENIKPNRIYLWNPSFYHVLELPLHTIKKLELKKGVEIKLQEA